MGRINKHGPSHARAMLIEAAWAAARLPGRSEPSSCVSATSVGIRSRRPLSRARS
ncbi:hypothetical protein [Mesorhizobium sp. M0998]|uniref:hypothetical protein n=1 Tax=Mesorhizobium sp. M0998 TaxID=2957044 RepID=UPI00333CAA71